MEEAIEHIRKRAGYTEDTAAIKLCWFGDRVVIVLSLHQMERDPRPEDFRVTSRKVGSKQKLLILAEALGAKTIPQWYVDEDDWSPLDEGHYIPGNLPLDEFLIVARDHMSASPPSSKDSFVTQVLCLQSMVSLTCLRHCVRGQFLYVRVFVNRRAQNV
jgi:hypothetical protein